MGTVIGVIVRGILESNINSRSIVIKIDLQSLRKLSEHFANFYGLPLLIALPPGTMLNYEEFCLL